eukprot:CAMPEP_0201716972 /NCGR_PEP_ID=MMETSP0593-20130828/2828_1 /ASSEMBLY_ACC=CAM_ASM_000672 /TAXON_ID=267983 /ORGANISM="Skeletonema japonicum, Strain CCMP2506" /LENGTH=184 /DNA_ID=CAMNT_0048206915 /DNA_START=466 /DNA_END=1020 /DNA_ORIENTATION=-
MRREIASSLDPSCPFCRFKDDGEFKKRRLKRIEANDPVAIYYEGFKEYENSNYISAFEWYTKATEFGYAEAHLKLAAMYYLGRGVEKDKGKEIHHLEEAAIGGHPDARYFLGKRELENHDYERAAKHYIIAAGQGDDDSIQMLMNVLFKAGIVSKEVLAATLRSHHAAVDATKSLQRETAPRIK